MFLLFEKMCIRDRDINILKKVRLEKLNELKANNANPYEITKFDVNAKNAEIKLNYEAEEKAIIEAADGNEEVVSAGLDKIKERIVFIAGRIMSWRDTVSYTHLDVYKRQVVWRFINCYIVRTEAPFF